MKTLAICQRKGGTAKSTTALSLGAALALFHKKRVLFVDLDAQGDLSDGLGAISGKAGVFECLTGSATAKEALQELEVLPKSAIIPASRQLSGADSIITQTGKEYRLKEALDTIAGDFDFCIIDTAPGLGILTINALTAANSVIIPCLADLWSIKATNEMLTTLDIVKKYTNHGLQIEGFLITRYPQRQVLAKTAAEKLEAGAKERGTRLFKTRIRETVAIREAVASGSHIFNYSPDSTAAKDYKQLAKEILGK